MLIIIIEQVVMKCQLHREKTTTKKNQISLYDIPAYFHEP